MAPYRNAISVKNIANIQVGHVPRNISVELAPLMDGNCVTVEGVVNEGNCTYASCFWISASAHSLLVTGFSYSLSM